MLSEKVTILICLLLLSGCASDWKIRGGPDECRAMCKKWKLEFVGMVGVGNQDATGPGATACVCQVQKLGEQVSSRKDGDASASASLAGPITAEQAAIAANAAIQQQRMMRSRSYNNGYR